MATEGVGELQSLLYVEWGSQGIREFVQYISDQAVPLPEGKTKVEFTVDEYPNDLFRPAGIERDSLLIHCVNLEIFHVSP